MVYLKKGRYVPVRECTLYSQDDCSCEYKEFSYFDMKSDITFYEVREESKETDLEELLNELCKGVRFLTNSFYMTLLIDIYDYLVQGYNFRNSLKLKEEVEGLNKALVENIRMDVN